MLAIELSSARTAPTGVAGSIWLMIAAGVKPTLPPKLAAFGSPLPHSVAAGFVLPRQNWPATSLTAPAVGSPSHSLGFPGTKMLSSAVVGSSRQKLLFGSNPTALAARAAEEI